MVFKVDKWILKGESIDLLYKTMDNNCGNQYFIYKNRVHRKGDLYADTSFGG